MYNEWARSRCSKQILLIQLLVSRTGSATGRLLFGDGSNESSPALLAAYANTACKSMQNTAIAKAIPPRVCNATEAPLS